MSQLWFTQNRESWSDFPLSHDLPAGCDGIVQCYDIKARRVPLLLTSISLFQGTHQALRARFYGQNHPVIKHLLQHEGLPAGGSGLNPLR